MKELLDYRRRMLVRFASIPGELERVVGWFAPEELNLYRESLGGSPYELLAQLYETERKTFAAQLEALVVPQRRLQDSGGIRGGSPVHDILEKYRALRVQELEWIQEMRVDVWNRSSRHPAWGRRTLQWWVESSLAHAEACLKQLKAALDNLDSREGANRNV